MATLSHQLSLTTNYLLKQTKLKPKAAIILGSGLGGIAANLENALPLAYKDLPHFPVTTVGGHEGRLLFGRLRGVPVMVFDGRLHFYEGLSMQHVVYPVYVAQRFGAAALLVTNAAGAINPALRPGDPMIICDHINLTGESPLRGPDAPEFGARFPSMRDAYDLEFREAAGRAAKANGIDAREGVYVAVKGPEYETAAELRMLQRLGADAVGMSTVPEVIAARRTGLRVFGLSVIANSASPDHQDGRAPVLTHEEVQRVVGGAAPSARAILEGVVERFRS